MTDPMTDLWGNPTHILEWSRVDCTGDVQRFDDHETMARRYEELVRQEPMAIFIVASAFDAAGPRPVARFRRDVDGSLELLSDERRARASYLCAGAQARHERRYGQHAIAAAAPNDAAVPEPRA